MPAEAWKQFDCYKILVVSRSATPGEIRRAYYAMSRRTHPDAGGSHDAQIRVNLAYEVLSDPVSRQAHDVFWYQGRPTSRGQTAYERTADSRRSTRETRTSTPLGSFFARVNARLSEEYERVRRDQSERVKANVANYERLYQAGFASRRIRFGVAAATTALALIASSQGVHIVWIAPAIAWLSFGSIATGVRVGARHVRFDDSNWRDTVAASGQEEAEHYGRLQGDRLERYRGYLASLTSLVRRSSTFEDSEDNVARRIAGALFVLGYRPVAFDRQNRILLFRDGDETMLVRFRHREGMATNVKYVERMIDAARQHNATRALLFCTPGLSGNGASLAERHGIRWYSLKTMNEWIDGVLTSQSSGPTGDVLKSLEELIVFVGQISSPLPYRRRF